MATEIQQKAKEILELPLFSEAFGKKIKKLDSELRETGNRLNPGTTADLTACCLLLYLYLND
jgi:triphosphoribosyl-dephospho-CoA synthetase